MTRVYAPENWTTDPSVDAAACLRAGKCGACGKLFFPAFDICPNCLGTEMEDVALSRDGTLYSFSVVRTASHGFDAPYAVGYVDLAEGPRVFGHLDGWQDAEIALDSPVNLYAGPIGRDSQGDTLLSVRFRPAAGGNR
jgi:uncharacterized OB-fold protein